MPTERGAPALLAVAWLRIKDPDEVELAVKWLKEIEAARAKERQGTRTDIKENFPESNGQSRDLAASKVGMSGKTAEKASEVVQVIDAMEAEICKDSLCLFFFLDYGIN